MYPSRCWCPVQYFGTSYPSLYRRSIAPTRAGCRSPSSPLDERSSPEFDGAGDEVRTFGDVGLEATRAKSALAPELSPQPESRLLAQELCILTEGGVTFGEVKGERYDDDGLELVCWT